MSPRYIAIFYPLWIGVVFNIFVTVFNMIGMMLRPHNTFVEWYLGNGFFWIMGIVWGLLVAWSIFNGITYRRPTR